MLRELNEAFRDKRGKTGVLTLTSQANSVGNIGKIIVHQFRRHDVDLQFHVSVFHAPTLLSRCGRQASLSIVKISTCRYFNSSEMKGTLHCHGLLLVSR